jgi:hypothetical protein
VGSARKHTSKKPKAQRRKETNDEDWKQGSCKPSTHSAKEKQLAKAPNPCTEQQENKRDFKQVRNEMNEPITKDVESQVESNQQHKMGIPYPSSELTIRSISRSYMFALRKSSRFSYSLQER